MEMNWSRWFHCESSFELLLVPRQPGIYALAEEIAQPSGPYSRRMLAVFEVEETEDLARALNRLFTAGKPRGGTAGEGRRSFCFSGGAGGGGGRGAGPGAEKRGGANPGGGGHDIFGTDVA